MFVCVIVCGVCIDISAVLSISREYVYKEAVGCTVRVCDHACILCVYMNIGREPCDQKGHIMEHTQDLACILLAH